MNRYALGSVVNDYATIVRGDGPVGYWRLGERTWVAPFKAVDDTSAHNDGTYQGSPTLDTAGALVADRDGAPTLNPRNFDYVSVPPNPNQVANQLTLECWLTIPGALNAYPATYAAAILKTSSNMNDGYGIYYFPYSVYFYVNQLNTRVGVPIPNKGNGMRSLDTTQSRFHHVVGTYDGATMKIYWDGVLAGTRTYSGTFNASTAPVVIGRGFGSTMGWYGKVDEVAIYNTALTPAQVQTHYQAGLAANPIDEVTTSTSSLYGNVIAIPANASSDLVATANMLKGQCSPSGVCSGLRAMVPNTTFSVQATNTPPAESIQLLRSVLASGATGYTGANPLEQRLIADLGTREIVAFAAVSEPAVPGLKIISRSDIGLQAGVSSYLRALGTRWLLPNDHWKFAPARSSVRWNVARVESPEFKWGSDFSPTGDYGTTKLLPEQIASQIAPVKDAWMAWKAQNLILMGPSVLRINKQDGVNFNQRWSAPTDLDDTMNVRAAWRARDANDNPVPWREDGIFGWHSIDTDFQYTFIHDRVDGTGPRGTTGIVNNSMAAYVAVDAYSPLSMSVSAEEADGVEDNGPSARAVGSPSDNVCTLANAVANRVAAKYPGQGRYASVQAYQGHSDVASIALAPNLIVSVCPNGFQRTGLIANDLVVAWSQKTPNLAVYDFWGVPDWEQGMPTLDPFSAIPAQVRFWRANGVNNVFTETTASAGAIGFSWYETGQLAWNTKVLDGPIRQAALDQAFGPDTGSSSVQAQMKDMLTRWARGFMLQPNELALAARNVVSALVATTDPAIRSRVIDYASYVHYLRLLYEWQGTAVDSSAQHDAADALIRYIWQIHGNGMVQTYRIMEEMITKWNGPTVTVQLSGDREVPNYPRCPPDGPAPGEWGGPCGTGWPTIGPLTLSEQDIVNLITGDVGSYPVLLTPLPAPFSDSIGPLLPPPVPSGVSHTTQNLFNTQTFVVYPRQAGSVSLQTRWRTAAAAPIHYKVWDPNGNLLSTTTDGTQSNVIPNVPNQWFAVAFTAAAPGAYKVEIDDLKTGSGYYIATPNELPFSPLNGFEAADVGAVPTYPSGTLVPAQWYFYVPIGTTRFALFAPQRAGVPITVRDATGAAVPCSNDASCMSDLIVIGVPAGRDGAAWSIDSNFKGTAGPLRLLNVPNLFAPTRDQVLKPCNIDVGGNSPPCP